jgi:hypothetical protein
MLYSIQWQTLVSELLQKSPRYHEHTWVHARKIRLQITAAPAADYDGREPSNGI